jgi:hypothetical protein
LQTQQHNAGELGVAGNNESERAASGIGNSIQESLLGSAASRWGCSFFGMAARSRVPDWTRTTRRVRLL